MSENIDSGMLQEALWEQMQEYGVGWPVADMVAVVRDLSKRPKVSRTTILEVVEARGLGRVPAGFATKVAERYARLSR